ncbi:MAG: hypothetical protein HQ534_02305 [Armatimonadetes bacterium]|nr:hypothetical protein [Armatimonadota bacterium]
MTENFLDSIGELSVQKRNRHISAIITFIESYLDDFIIIYYDEYSNITNETGITHELCSFFESKINEHPFYFHHEDRAIPDSGQSPSVDFGVKTREPFGEFKNRQTVFSIEAKRLPTLGSGREKEYVLSPTGKSGGIERFKKGIHGSGLKYSAIIGYVQKNDFSFWFSKINYWIDELIKDESQNIEWTEEDKLTKIYFEQKKAKLISKNKQRKDYIFLYHFWIDLRSN